jgi:hypothetical protein
MKLDVVISETPLAVSLYRQTQEHKDDRSQEYGILWLNGALNW